MISFQEYAMFLIGCLCFLGKGGGASSDQQDPGGFGVHTAEVSSVEAVQRRAAAGHRETAQTKRLTQYRQSEQVERRGESPESE